jgi:hypothetical protein
VQVAPPRGSPTDEFDAELEGRLGLAHELPFVETDDLVEPVDRRNRGLADADDADVVGFDELDRTLPQIDCLGEGGRRHPPGGAASNDDDLPDAILVHVKSIA